MARSKFIRILTKLTGSIGANELVTRELAFEDSTDSIVIRKPNGALVRINNSNSITQQPYQPSPTLTSLRDALVLSGVMAAQPTYSVTGAISGSGTSGVALQLVGTSTYNTTSDGSGNFTFTGIPNGTYTLTPTLSGFSYSPANRNVVVNNANITAQNFTGSAFVSSAETTSTHFFATGAGSNTVRAIRKSDRGIESATFNAIPAFTITQNRFVVHNNRIFFPANDNIYVFDATTFAHVRTIPPTFFGQLGVVRVYASGSKLCAMNQTSATFFTFDNSTNTETISGSTINFTNGINDATSNGVDLFIGHAASPSSYNITRLNWASQTPTSTMLSGWFNGTAINSITAGATDLLVTTTSVYERYSIASLTQNGTVQSIGGDLQGRVGYTGGKFWITTPLDIRYIVEATGVLSTITSFTPSGVDFRGVTVDSNFVYAADTNNRIFVIDPTTNAQNGAAVSVTGIGSVSYLRA